MKFSDKLKELMTENGLTERSLAEKAGVPYGTLHMYTSDHRIPAFDVVMKLADALGVGVEVFSKCTFSYREQKKRKATNPKTRKSQAD